MPTFNEPIYGYPYVYRVPGLVIGFAREWLRFFGFHTGWLRATLVALLLFGLTLAEVCLAAKLGVMTVRSAQGQPFDAEVALLDWDEAAERPRVVPVEPLRVRLAGRDEVLWPTAWLDTARIGNTVIRIRTEFEITNPQFELTLRIESHRGQMVVTYPISLRPPSLNLTGPGERVRGIVALDNVAGAAFPKPSTRPQTTSREPQQDRLPPCPADLTASWHNCFGIRGHLGGGRYAGEWQDNKRHGQGMQVLPSGARYVGEFKEDKFHGQGIYYEANRSIFRSGRWENDRVVQSFAIDPATLPFESESERRRLEAERLAREASERKAAEVRAEEERLAREANERKVAEARAEAERRRREAERQASAATGRVQSSLPPCPTDPADRWHNCFGTYTSPRGDRYVGEYRDDKQHGRGTWTHPNGERYVGGYWDGKRSGRGTFTHPRGDRYVGEWRDGKQHGQGTYTWPSGATYAGEHREGKRSGFGTYTWPSGAKYVGEFRDDKSHGQGIHYAANGSILESGRWEDDKFAQSYPLSTAQYPFTASDSSAQSETARRQAAAEAERKRRQELERQLVEERRKREAAERRANNAQESTGTGFMVSPGILVTNHHVVERCERLDIVSLDGRRTGVVLDKDESVDLALVRVTGLGGVVAVLRRPGSVRLGEPAYAFGFPLAGLLSEGGNFTNGVVSGLRGMRDSANEIQITTPVQPGNSGGAVIDSSGNVMGVVVSKLNAAAVAKATGDIPQNVNFAVSIAALTDFLGRNKVSYRTAERGTSIDSAQLADMARSVSHRIVCTGQVTADRRGSGSQTDNDSGDTTVILWNQSTEAIFSVFVSPVSSDKWGVDQLGREVISPGGRFTLKPPASQGCTYDVRVEFKSGKHQEKRNQNFCRMVDLKIDG